MPWIFASVNYVRISCNLWKLDCFLPFLLVQFLQPEKFLWVYPTDCLTAKLTGRATTECFDVVKNARSCDLDTRRTGSNIGFQSMIFNLWCTGTNHIGNICLNQLLKMQRVVTNFLSCLRIYSWYRLSNGIFGKSWDFVKDAGSSLQSPLSKPKPNCIAFHCFTNIFSL